MLIMNNTVASAINSPTLETARPNSAGNQFPSELPSSSPPDSGVSPRDRAEQLVATSPVAKGLTNHGSAQLRSFCCITAKRAKLAWRERMRKRRRHAENRRIILALKAAGCWLCGDKTCPTYDLHFHHLGEKKDCIARLLTRSVEALLGEICTTRLICTRCHCEHHEILDSKTWKTGGVYDI